jgi:hypothetical protein
MAAAAVTIEPALASSLAAPASGWVASDAAWERLVSMLHDVVESISCQFDSLLESKEASQDVGMHDGPQMLDLKTPPSLPMDVGMVRTAGDGDLLDEVALDLVLVSLRSHVIPKFWASMYRLGGGAKEESLIQDWQLRFCGGVGALLQLFTAHTSLLSMMGSPQGSGSHPVVLYKISFRVAVQEQWPAGFADELLCFFRYSWQQSAQESRKRRKEIRQGGISESEYGTEEWWCLPATGQPALRNPADRVLLLLNPARRPFLVVGVDATMGDGNVIATHGEGEPWQADAAWVANDDCDESLAVESSDEEDIIPASRSSDYACAL